MSLRHDLRTQVELSCVVSWGTDPKIELSGVALEIGVESMLVTLRQDDRLLWPAEGRKVRLQVAWSAPQTQAATNSKFLICRGLVERIREQPDGSLRLLCTIRKGRFVDTDWLSRPPYFRSAPSKWTM